MQPPAVATTMKGAINAGIPAIALVYSCIALVSYLALGNGVPGFVLDGYPSMDGERCLLAAVRHAAVACLRVCMQAWGGGRGSCASQLHAAVAGSCPSHAGHTHPPCAGAPQIVLLVGYFAVAAQTLFTWQVRSLGRRSQRHRGAAPRGPVFRATRGDGWPTLSLTPRRRCSAHLQVWAQPMYRTLEGLVLSWRRHRKKKAHASAAAAVTAAYSSKQLEEDQEAAESAGKSARSSQPSTPLSEGPMSLAAEDASDLRLPPWQRVLLRCTYVLTMAALAIVIVSSTWRGATPDVCLGCACRGMPPKLALEPSVLLVPEHAHACSALTPSLVCAAAVLRLPAGPGKRCPAIACMRPACVGPRTVGARQPTASTAARPAGCHATRP